MSMIIRLSSGGKRVIKSKMMKDVYIYIYIYISF